MLEGLASNNRFSLYFGHYRPKWVQNVGHSFTAFGCSKNPNTIVPRLLSISRFIAAQSGDHLTHGDLSNANPFLQQRPLLGVRFALRNRSHVKTARRQWEQIPCQNRPPPMGTDPMPKPPAANGQVTNTRIDSQKPIRIQIGRFGLNWVLYYGHFVLFWVFETTQTRFSKIPLQQKGKAVDTLQFEPIHIHVGYSSRKWVQILGHFVLFWVIIGPK
jgi:hypothetical protein